MIENFSPFQKHLHNLLINGFYERDLDADDLEFLEYVRHCGSANGSLPHNGAVLLEELEFWQSPYTIAPDIQRTLGPRPRLVMTAEQRAMRQARQSEWKARRIIREQQKAIADAELAREQREWELAKAVRALRHLRSDAEWENAAPRKAAFGITVKRHHVPQWKVDETQHRQRQREEAAPQNEAERQRREQIIAEARATVTRIRQQEREWQRETGPTPDQVLTLIKGTSPHVWTRDEIARSLGCTNLSALDETLSQLVRDGKLRGRVS